MIALRRLLCVFLLFVAPLAFAGTATNPKDPAKSLKGKTVFLRGMEAGDNLSFDAQGNEVGSYQTVPFAYGAVRVEKIEVSNKQMTIEGRRVAVVLHAKSNTVWLSDAQYVPLRNHVEVTVKLDTAHSEEAETAIRKVFAFSAAEVVGGLSPVAQKLAIYSLGSDAPPDGKIATPYKVGVAGVSAPRLTYSVAPNYSTEAKIKKLDGLCVLQAIIDTSGRPEHIRVVHSAGHGLDLQAVIAFSQYRFTPAKLNGISVPVAINIAINFRIV